VSLAGLHLSVHDGVVRAELSGEVDMSNAESLLRAIAHGGPSCATARILDLSAVDYLDSAGIHLLYRLRENLRIRGQALLVVIPADSPVKDALRLAGVLEHIDAFASTDEALRALPADP
jgi:anti-sigma B factor antagonist